MYARPLTVSLIVPQYGQTDRTALLLMQLRARETAPCEVVIVDDGSPLDNPFPWKPAPDRVCVRQFRAGVTTAWNRGAQIARGEVLVFLNNDVRIEGPFVEAIRSQLAKRSVSLAGVKWRNERAVPRELLRNRSFPLLEGWCFAVRRRDFERLNGFDETMRLYFSDTDFQWRMQQWYPRRRFAAVPGLPLVHEGHATTRMLPERRAVWLRDCERFIEKWTGR